MLIDGTGDPIVPYAGGPIAHRGNQSSVIGAERTVALWVGSEHCNATPVRANLPDVDPSDGTTISTAVYSGCANGNTVALYTVNGGGHEWPGGRPTRILPLAIGKLNNDINATDTIWKFFAQHAK
jgi:polyhydroxybutyrate depolymerase